MKTVYFRELDKYTDEEFKEKLQLSVNEYKIIKKDLMKKRIVKEVDNRKYCFNFVGVVIISNILIFCIPKYIETTDYKIVMKQLLMLFRVYSKTENLDEDELESLGEFQGVENYNMLSTIIFLLEDYLENGIYSNEKEVTILNGDDEINWQKTIDNLNPIITRGNPLYLDYYSQVNIDDENNFFKLLHMHILTRCTKILLKCNLIDYLEFPEIIFNIDEHNFQVLDVIQAKLIQELSIQFTNRKQRVLKAMYAFLTQEQVSNYDLYTSFYGSRNFELVWEKICSFTFSNKYGNNKDLDINKPKWTPINGKEKSGKGTLIPDIITDYNKDNINCFIILDAKYYNIKFNREKLENYPGIGDITKQYLYQLAYSKYIIDNDYNRVYNILIFPSEKNTQYCGSVEVDFLKDINLENIKILKLSAYDIFNKYVLRKRINLEEILKEIDSNQKKYNNDNQENSC